MASEIQQKLERVRRWLSQQQAKAAHFGNLGNLSWLLGGGDTLVSFTDPPVAEVLVTESEARLLTREIERDRLEAEEVPEGITVTYLPWEDPEAFAQARAALAEPADTLTDTLLPGMRHADYYPLRVPLLEGEKERYRRLGRDAAAALGRAMRGLEPGLSEHQIAARAAAELRAAGIQPAVLLVGGDTRLKRFRHPLPRDEQVHHRAMVVVCGRRDGLYANLTRIAGFTPLGPQEARRYRSLLEIEAAALALTRSGRFLRETMGALCQAYSEHGYPDAWKHHHQGGPTGYFTRDFLAVPNDDRMVASDAAYAWNPSLPGLKVEDTVLLGRQGVEILTEDPEWPSTEVGGLRRPEILMLG